MKLVPQSVLASVATALIASTASAQQSAPQWTGFSVERTITAAGNTQYKVYGNWNASNIVMLNALDFGKNIAGQPAQFGTMNARHQDAGEDADGNPLASWHANVNLLGTAARDNDSWVTASGSGTSGGNDTALDPSFVYPFGSTDRSFIPLNAGWYDATPGTANPVLAGGTQGGYRMLFLQIVRTGSGADPQARFHCATGFKVANTTQALFGFGSFTIGNPDTDGDGVPDSSDNCPSVANPNQANNDGDAQGDVCDTDDDNDGVMDTSDNCPFSANPTQANNDGDGQGDVCDTDDDNDGVPDASDNCPSVANPNQANNDGDGQGDVCDTDDDNDGVPDASDNCPFAANPTQSDCDNDGVGDSCESGVGAIDCNSDGVPDLCQGLVEVARTSGNLGPPDSAVHLTFTFGSLLFSESPTVQVTVDVRGDLDGQTEWIDVKLNSLVTRLFQADGDDCPAEPNRAVISLSRAQFASLLAETGGSLVATVMAPPGVDPYECKGSGLTEISLSYLGVGASGDCDGDRRLDVCAIAQGLVSDCNGNGVPDSCDIAANPSLDCNSNLALDSCEIAANPSLDCNGNSALDSCDVASGASPDIDGNGRPDECQTTTVAAGGSIQQAIDGSSASELRIIALGTGTYAGPIHVDGRPVIIRGAGAGVTIIEGSGGAQASVVRLSNAPAISAIENVTIRGGLTGTSFPTFPTAIVGGGLFVYQGNITMRNCIVEDNAAGFGGGAYIWRATGLIENCQFRNNAASADGGGFQLFGGSIDVVDTSATNNFANSRGGGAHVVEGNHEFDGVRIEGNESNNIVGGLSWVPGNPSLNAFLAVRESQVVGNTAQVDFGGLDIVDNGAGIRTSLESSQVCGNQPRPNVRGEFADLGGNTVCECPGDLNGDSRVDSVDLTMVLVEIGACSGECAGDANGDGAVDGLDLTVVLVGWGVCPAEGLLTGVSPSSGPFAGGTQITITGTYLTGATQVRIGANACTGVQVINSSTIVAVTPAGSAVGAQNVSVVTPLGTLTGEGLFSYTGAVPAWATVIEWVPDPAVVYDAAQREAILATGFPWRVKDTATQIEMLLIPPGTFNMGCSASNQYGCEGDESPVHQVTLTNAFYLGRYEVTQAQWQATMGYNPSYWQGDSNRPVEQVSWNTIQGFLSQTGMRLPTEAEWEYACRGGTTTAFHGWPANPSGTNDDNQVGNIAWYYYNTCSGGSGCGTRAVGQKFANGFGLHDMGGNVWEWVNDWYGGYSADAQTNPQGPSSGSYRVLRGGSWTNSSSGVRSSNRTNVTPVNSYYGIGFRVSRTP